MQHKLNIRIKMTPTAIHCGMRCADIVWLAATRTVPDSCCPSRPTSRSVLLSSQEVFQTYSQLLPGIGEHDFACCSVQQSHTGLALQLFNAVADG
jgi:hypothetical protein